MRRSGVLILISRVCLRNRTNPASSKLQMRYEMSPLDCVVCTGGKSPQSQKGLDQQDESRDHVDHNDDKHCKVLEQPHHLAY